MIGNMKKRDRFALNLHLLAILFVSLSSQSGQSADLGASMGSGLNSPSQRLAVALQQIRMTACAPMVQRAGVFLMQDGEANFSVQPLGPDADRWPVVVTIESQHKDLGTTRFSTIIVNPSEACSGMYQQIIYWNDSCENVKSKIFGNYRSEQIILKTVHVSETGPGVQLYTIPSGGGCTTVKKELFR